jgi:peroxiredoxin
MERSTVSANFSIGSDLPEFTLPCTDGSNISSREFFATAKASLVIFTCNHCPYVKGSEAALNNVVRELLPNGLNVLAISSNDAIQYPDDSFDKMKEKAIELNLPYPYLYDESQTVAKLFDAACTPECYLFDKDLKLAFHGTINNSPRDPSKVTQSYLAQAINQVLVGEKAVPEFVHPIGCSIKWK